MRNCSARSTTSSFFHDPQPAGILAFREKGSARWIWRCHIDTARPNPDIWEFLRGRLEPFDAAVFTMKQFVPPDLPVGRVEIYHQVREASQQDAGIHVFTNLTGIGNIEVNAFQRLSQLVVQKSIREGFGLVIAEALWKGTPVVAGKAGGISLQMADGVGGALVDGIDDCAQAIVALLRDPERARELAFGGRARVRKHFLLPRLLLNEVELMRELASGRRPLPLEHRDPVCGMAVAADEPAPEERAGETTYRFCSEACRSQFARHPRHYAVARTPMVTHE
jgi:glycosyltransferase involved in cell wall biosynthesis/YHS domain-containing protein